MKIIDVLEYEGDGTTFVWKHPCEDFNIFTQLIVHENQEAIFFMNGQALDLFGPGRYTLKTQNIPIIGKVLSLPTGGKTPFHCEVYFIDKSEQMSIRWGTDSRVQFIEPSYNFPLSIGACGEMTLRAADSRKLLVKVVGTQKNLSQEKLVAYFRAFLMTRVKSYIAQSIKSQGISIFEIDEKLTQLSDIVKEPLTADFLDYGISLEKFLVTRVMRPEGDPQYERFKELYFRQFADITEAKIRQQTQIIDAQTEAQKTVIGSKAQATKRAQEGYTYGQERGFDVAQGVAANEAVGQFTNMGVGLGTMAGVGGAVGGMVGGVMNGALASATAQPVMQPAAGMSPAFAGTAGAAGVAGAAATGAAAGVAGAAGAAGVAGAAAMGAAAGVADASVFCDSCGAKLAPGVAFCEECGAPVTVHHDTCANCGYVFERQSKFCPRCGAKRGDMQ